MLSKFIKLLCNNYNDTSYNLTINKINFDEAIKEIDIKNINNPKSIINKEFNKLKYENIITFKTLNYDIKINCYSYNKLSKYEINKIVNRINCMILSFNKNIEVKPIEIFIYLYNVPRIISETYIDSPSNFQKINKYDLFNCVNGYYNNKNNRHKILITRLNTYKGLLTHELCHMCKLDFGGYDTFNDWDEDKKFFGINNFSKFTEGINNAISSIIHSIFITLEEYGKNNFNNNFAKIFYCECNYSNDLVANLLHYFKCNKIKDLKKSGYNQDSMVFEYIILRNIYLKNLKELFHIDKNYNEKDYYKKFMHYLQKDLNTKYIFNANMLIDNINVVRMEYYLF